MVLRSFTRESLSIRVDRSKIDALRAKVKERFKDKIRIRFEGDKAIVEGEELNNYRVHESLIYILTEGKHGKDL